MAPLPEVPALREALRGLDAEALRALLRDVVAAAGAHARIAEALGVRTAARAAVPEQATETASGVSVTPAPVTSTSGFAPTPEQEAIVGAASDGGHLVIEAGAGTGKTSTLTLIGRALGEKRGLYVAFNKAIATEAKRKMPGNVTAATAHSLAFQAVGKRFKHRLDGPRVPARRTAELLGVTSPYALGEVRLSEAKQASLAAEMVTRFCHSADRDLTLAHVPFVHGLSKSQVRGLASHLLPLAERIWADVQRTDGRHRFTHDHYLKMWQLTGPDLKADFVLFDEAQDANPVIADVVRRQDGTQQIVVGDSAQQIYAWRGAVDALETWPAEVRLRLTTSFRFGEAIAAEANTWLGELGASLRLAGNPAKASQVARAGRADAVLCRTNAAAIAGAMETMGGGGRAALVGGGTTIQRLAEAARDLQRGKGTSHPELFAFQSWGEVQQYVKDEPEAAGELSTLVRLIDDHGPEEIISATRRLSDEKSAEVVYSTAHKAKGREWASVRIADDFREPKARPDGSPAPVPRSDAMLAYVAVTRAMDHLDNGGLSWIHHRGQEPTKLRLLGE